MQNNPYAAPKSEVDASEAVIPLTEAELESTAQFLNLTVILYLALQVTHFAGGLIFNLLILVGYLGSIFYLSKSIKVERPWLCLVGSLIPLINLIILIVLVRKASALLKAGGYKIGLMGAKKVGVGSN